MNFNWKAIVQYLVSLGFGFGLFYFLYRDQDILEVFEVIGQVSWLWVAASIVAGLVSHAARSNRWVLGLKPLGYCPAKFHAFLALMVGYLVNLAIPRLGEFVRCAVLKRTDQVPVNVAFGAVLAERALDLLVLLLLAVTVLFLEFEQVGYFVAEQLQNSSLYSLTNLALLAAVGVAGMTMLWVLFRYRTRFRKNLLFQKAQHFLSGIRDGLLAMGKLSAKDLSLFLLYTFTIWAMYFCMSYFLFFSTPQTMELGARCALSVLVLSGIGMAIPTPGGAGSYHFFVTFSLVAYGLSENLARYFAFYMHGLQTIALVVLGSLFLVITLVIVNRKKPADSGEAWYQTLWENTKSS
jgi:uncharacterized protein (TIRG00374 family)